MIDYPPSMSPGTPMGETSAAPSGPSLPSPTEASEEAFFDADTIAGPGGMAGGEPAGPVPPVAAGAPGRPELPASPRTAAEAEAAIFAVHEVCRGCPVNRHCPQAECAWWRVEQEAREVQSVAGVLMKPTIGL
jgi:hypothetical protein